jgi:hypothetical protein
MAISNLSSQYISSSYQNLLQISASGEIFDGSGTQVTKLVLTSVTASLDGLITSASVAVTANTATTASYISPTFISASAAASGFVPVTINNNVNNYLVTATGTNNTLNGESSLIWDGSKLNVTGSLTVTGTFVVPTQIAASPQNGSMYWSAPYLYIYDGGSWVSVQLS